MGKETERAAGEVDKRAGTETGAGTGGKAGGKTGGSKSPADSRTGTGGTGGTGGSGTGAAGKTAEKEPGKKPVGLADVRQPEPVAVKPGEVPEPKKPKARPKKVSKKKKQESKIPAEQVDKLIVGMSQMVAARPNCAHWAITEQEAHGISEPLCNILERSGLLEKMGENTDAIALVVACSTVFVPRIMLTASIRKEVKRSAITGNSTNTSVQPGKQRQHKGRPSGGTGGSGNERDDKRTGSAVHDSGSTANLSGFGPVTA